MFEFPGTGPMLVLDYVVDSESHWDDSVVSVVIISVVIIRVFDMSLNLTRQRTLLTSRIYRLLAEPGRSTSP